MCAPQDHCSGHRDLGLARPGGVFEEGRVVARHAAWILQPVNGAEVSGAFVLMSGAALDCCSRDQSLDSYWTLIAEVIARDGWPFR